jgi:S-adenosylmethionine:tRNA ribosyltransferase-isomerase
MFLNPSDASTDSFDYELPTHLIAQYPAVPRDQARLMVVRRDKQTVEHRRFFELPELLSPGDLLVLNDTRVVPARLVGRRARTGGKWEGLFLHEVSEGRWEILARTRGRLEPGETIRLEPGALELVLMAKTDEGHWVVRAVSNSARQASALELLEAHGHVPLPPYIRKGADTAEDRDRYQTVFARQAGAVAAPTAGLHFTPAVFEHLKDRGVGVGFVTLHVGLGTFQPIQVADISEHRMHEEWGELRAATAKEISTCKAREGKVVAVGTTSVRVLETAGSNGTVGPWAGQTGLYIYPPYPFKIVDALITNFHLPRTSLLVLVSAFAGIDLIRDAYKKAIEAEYRFYSYGDAMLIL